MKRLLLLGIFLISMLIIQGCGNKSIIDRLSPGNWFKNEKVQEENQVKEEHFGLNGAYEKALLFVIFLIGGVVFFAMLNQTKWYIAAIGGLSTIGTLLLVGITCAKLLGYVAGIALGLGLILLVISLFRKHRGLFIGWAGKGNKADEEPDNERVD